MVSVAIAPASSVVTVTATSLAKPFLLAVLPSAAGASASAAGSSSLSASTTAVEVTVAPVTASTPSPRVKGAVLPINWLVKASSAHFCPRPAVSPEASMVSVAIAPASSVVTVTATSLAKPFLLAVLPSAAGASASAAGAAVDSAPSVTLPFSTVRFTSRSPVKPSAGMITAAPSGFTPRVAPSSSAMGSITSAGAEVGADSSSLTASTTAVEVMVAPVTASMPSPRASGADLPMNWLVKASSAQRWPRPSVSPDASTESVAIAPAPSVVRVTVTSLTKPFLLAVMPSAAAGAAPLTASITALEVTVAPASASTPSTGIVLPMKRSVNSASMQRWPRPGV